MAQITADRILETSTTTGTGAYTLAGALTGFRAFSTVCANGDTVDVFVEEVNGNGNPTGAWEAGTYTWGTGGTLTRTAITASTNANAAVSWAAGTRRIGLTVNKAALDRKANLASPTFTGAVTVSSSSNPAIGIVDTGSGNGANLKLTGNGATTPSKVIRARAGLLEVVNDGNTAIIASLSDAGAFSAASFTGSGAGLSGTASSLTTGDANAVNGISGWTYTNTVTNPAYIWCTEGSGSYQHLTTPAALSVGYASQANSLNGAITTSGGTFTGNLTANGTMSTGSGYWWNANSGNFALNTGNYTTSGIYRYIPIANANAHGDTSSCGAYHQVSVESFWQWNIGGSGNYFRMSNNGVGYSQGGWTNTSDVRVKKNRVVIQDALDKVDALTGYTYDRTDMIEYSGLVPRKAGVIAQDVLNILPEAVIVPANYDRDAITGDKLSLHTDALVGLLVNAIKELRIEVKALKEASK